MSLSLRPSAQTVEYLWDAEQAKNARTVLCNGWGCSGRFVQWKEPWGRNTITRVCNIVPYPVDRTWLGPISSYNRIMTPKTPSVTMCQQYLKNKQSAKYSGCNGVSSTVSGSEPCWAVVGAAWTYGTEGDSSSQSCGKLFRKHGV